MLTLTTPDGTTISADTDVELASKWLDHQHGTDWDTGVIPFDQHDVIHSTIEEIALMRDGSLSGYTVTESTPIDTATLARFVDAFTWDTAGDVAATLNCGEVDALADLLRAAGATDRATLWIERHAEGDEEGDAHYLGTDQEAGR
ncbi:hypothetical protein [Herbiconiux sp. YIM B11900]|uniref:hypothetical protein n=1 Tax=Herbiconiux sp. YIM B11900 TaxID=3404131 RepID=UPI003F86A7AD